MQVLKRATLQIRSDLDALSDVLSWYDELKLPEIPMKTWLECQTALGEGFTNAVRHAHQPLSLDVPVEIILTLFQEAIEIQIWDQGQGFDLDQKLEELLARRAENPEREGGHGVLMMKQIADHLSYTARPDHRNCLLFVKSYRVSEATEESSITLSQSS